MWVLHETYRIQRVRPVRHADASHIARLIVCVQPHSEEIETHEHTEPEPSSSHRPPRSGHLGTFLATYFYTWYVIYMAYTRILCIPGTSTHSYHTGTDFTTEDLFQRKWRRGRKRKRILEISISESIFRFTRIRDRL